jgi:hypothetical protein
MIYFLMTFVVIASLASSKVENPEWRDNAREETIRFEIHASKQNLKEALRRLEIIEKQRANKGADDERGSKNRDN